MTALLGHRRASASDNPIWRASWGVRSASLLLPSAHRYRYRQEFLAELYGMTPPQQLHQATGVLFRVWTLRAALDEPARSCPRRPPWPSPCSVELDGTPGNACVTPTAAGIANAAVAESSVSIATRKVPDLCRWTDADNATYC